jgi:drug/metabolite transporter (DMT)-like permease
MGQVDLLRFLSLAAIWGSSYMFMRVAAPAFGPLPMVMLPAAGSMLAAAILLVPGGLAMWPRDTPPPLDWFAVGVLALVCTACAYLLYYKLITRISATALTGVTFVIPVFGVLWGALFLHEAITLRIVAGMGVTLLGTAFTTGLIGAKR